jgi:hypothetical protein
MQELLAAPGGIVRLSAFSMAKEFSKTRMKVFYFSSLAKRCVRGGVMEWHVAEGEEVAAEGYLAFRRD